MGRAGDEFAGVVMARATLGKADGRTSIALEGVRGGKRGACRVDESPYRTYRLHVAPALAKPELPGFAKATRV
jgi:hypothetical protein